MSLKNAFNPQTPWEILLDLDGVVADFDGHAKAHDKFDAKGQPKWDELDVAWWSTMPQYPGARDFFYALKKTAPLRFLTAPILSSACFTGKAMWIEKLRNRFALLDLIICPAKDKHFLARPNRVLVDDREKNIKEWASAGGVGVLHRGNFEETLAALQAIIAGTPAIATPLQQHEPRVFVNISRVLADFATHATVHDKFNGKGELKWDELDANWWKTMPAFEGAPAFFEELRDLAETRFLTAPVPNVDGFTGKPEWVQQFLPARGKFSLLDLIVCRGLDKELLARPTNILIDDSARDVAAWIKAGGIGVHHTGDFAESLRQVKVALDQLGYKKPAPMASKTPKP